MNEGTRAAVRRELERIAFASLGDYMTVDGDGARARGDIPAEKMAAVQAVHTGSNKVTEVKLYDKMKALEMLVSMGDGDFFGDGAGEGVDNAHGGSMGAAAAAPGRVVVEVVRSDAHGDAVSAGSAHGSTMGGDAGDGGHPAEAPARREWVDAGGE